MFQFRKYIFAGLIAVFIISFSIVVFWLAQSSKESQVPKLFITANPFNLTQIRAFSKYRSCEGHDYRAPTLDGKMEKTPRSMKHYVTVRQKFRGTTGKVDLFAPFDGEVSAIKNEKSSDDNQVWLTPNPHAVSQWQFIFFHLILDKGFKKGTSITAGQHIGTANLVRGPDGATDNFDISLKFTRPLRRPAIEAPFNHATDKVISEYKKYGIDVGDFVISKEYRDTHPCPIAPNHNNGSEAIFPPGSRTDDYVWLTDPKF